MNKIVEIDSRFDKDTLLELCNTTPDMSFAGAYGWNHIKYDNILVRTIFNPKSDNRRPMYWTSVDKVAVGEYQGVIGTWYLGKFNTTKLAPYEK